MLQYNSFCSLALGKKTTSAVILDNCGNTWKCIAVYGTQSHTHINIGGAWGRLVDARRLGVGMKIRIGVPNPGKNEKIFLTIQMLFSYRLDLVYFRLCFMSVVSLCVIVVECPMSAFFY